MGIGPGPGETYKVECTHKLDHTASFAGDLAIAISGTQEQIGYYEFHKSYIFHVRPVDGDQPDGGTPAASAT